MWKGIGPSLDINIKKIYFLPEPVIKIIKKRGRPRKTDKKPEESGNKVTVKNKQVVKKSATQGKYVVVRNVSK